jgi:aminobenzoyl-glutamate utilization protein B
MAEHVLTVLDRNAGHAAAMAHCELSTTWVARNRPGRTNHVLAQALYTNLEAVGAPRYGSAAIAAAQDIQRSLGVEPMEKPFLDECEQLISPQDAEEALREHLAPWQKNWTSDDYVEMTHYAPTVRFYVARPALKPLPGKGAYPGWVMNALGGIAETIDPTIEVAGKTIAGTFVDLLTAPEILAEAKAEFDERVLADPMPALLPENFMPPVELAWPDYASAPGGGRIWYPKSTRS